MITIEKLQDKPVDEGWINAYINWKVRGVYFLYGKDLARVMIEYFKHRTYLQTINNLPR